MSDFRDVWYQSPDGLRLYARDYPGPASSGLLPVLCMHGLSRNSADFAELASTLAAERRVIVAEQRGRGRSDYDSNPANYTPLTYAGDMFHLLDTLSLKKVVLIGTSMGGLMSFIMASQQPERVAGMVINDIGPEIDPRGLARIQHYVGKVAPARSWDEAVARTREINGEAFPDYTDDDWLGFARALYVEHDGVPVLAYDPAISQTMNDDDSDAVPPDLWPLFEAIVDIPMLVIRGELSDILAPECVARMRDRDSDLSVTEVPRVGHAPTLMEPTALQAIQSFLSSGSIRA
ncbi:MAG: alpha/beta fold hydrolase [Chromatocurvus sp.]